VPAAGLYTTAADISRFMIAHLQFGLLGGTRILNEATAKEMQARHFIHHPNLRGRAYGFSELFVNGQRIVFHDGGMPGFTSRLCLLPEAGLGFFVAYNSDDLGTKAVVTTRLMDGIFPAGVKSAPGPAAGAAGNASDFTGTYDQVAGFATNGLRLGSMLQNHVVVKAAGGGRLAAFGGEYGEVEPLLFRDEGGNHVAFGKGDDGRICYLYAGSGAYEKLGFLESPTALLCLASIFILASLPMGVVWPIGILVRPGRFRASWQRLFPSGRLVAGVESFLIVLFLACFVGLFLQLDSYWQIMRNEYPWSWVTKLLAVPIAVAALAPALFFCAERAWVKAQGTLFGRLCMSGAAGATGFFVWTLWRWHLIGFNY